VRRPSSCVEYSAGGLMLDPSRTQGLVIRRASRRDRPDWSLPKGHIEPGESSRQAAEREVFEETGIRGSAGPELGRIDYWFQAGHGRVHKYVRHYLRDMRGGELSTDDHEVVEVAWFPLRDLSRLLSHRDERRILTCALELLGKPPVDERAPWISTS
jgi:8-oxo-dGTP pyrophosphatase MutT (NUDIX family)